MPNKYVAGRVYREGSPPAWQFRGVFDDEAQAFGVCEQPDDFYFRAELNREAPYAERDPLKEARFPVERQPEPEPLPTAVDDPLFGPEVDDELYEGDT